MDKYSCKRCGYSIDKKYNYLKHLNRKNSCKILLENISIEDLKKEIENKEEKKYDCKFCIKNFNCKQGKYQHEKRCKDNINNKNNNINLKLLKKINELEEKNNKLEEKIKVIENQKPLVQNIYNNQSNNIYNNDNKTYNNKSITTNNNLNNFGEENLSHITFDKLTRYSSSLNKGFSNFIENVHFNEEIKENNNIRMKTKDILEVVDNGKWIEKDCNNTIDEMIMKGHKVLFRHFIDNKDKEERLNDLSEVLQEYFLGLINTSTDYYKLRREIYFVIKNNTLYLMQNPSSS